jgi:hypothetical protein
MNETDESLSHRILPSWRLISFTFANDVVGEGMLVYEINGEYELRGFR